MESKSDMELLWIPLIKVFPSIGLILDNLTCSLQNVSSGETSELRFDMLHSFIPSKSSALLKNSGLLDLSKSDRQLQVNP